MSVSKNNQKRLFALFLICNCFAVHGQSAFQNLDFESANLSATPTNQQGITIGGYVSTADGIPNWTAYTGPVQVTQMYQNNETAGAAAVDILGPNFYGGGPSPVIQGNYTVVFQAGEGFNGTTFGLVGASISQTGFVPANSESLQFEARPFGSFFVTLGGQNLAIIPIGTGANYTIYGANISQFAGQTETLTIGVPGIANDGGFFDSFVLSPVPVPEPSSLLLLILGAGSFALKRKFKIKT